MKTPRLQFSFRPSGLALRCVALAILISAIATCDVAMAQPGQGLGRGQGQGLGRGQGQGQGRGPGHGQGLGRGRGRGMSGDMREDMTTLHAMFAARDKIDRRITMLPRGAESITESNDAKITALIQEHVPAMEGRVHGDKPLPPMTFHPIFVNLIKHADDYTFSYEDTEKGIKVTYEAQDPFVIMLVQEHAKLVSRFVKNGMEEIHKPYTLPNATALKTASNPRTSNSGSEYINPTITEYGKVVRLPDASHQPRDHSKFVVDVTKGGEPDKLNPAIEKVCRFVNIYAGAGKTPAKADIAVVLHGDATLAVLNADAYSTRFKTKSNPNLDCLSELHRAGVKIFVCGQSLIGKGAKPDDVVETADVAVSALTSLVNLQADGYGYVPLGK